MIYDDLTMRNLQHPKCPTSNGALVRRDDDNNIIKSSFQTGISRNSTRYYVFQTFREIINANIQYRYKPKTERNCIIV